jgi:autotransporter translocation and assembly factor TamB
MRRNLEARLPRIRIGGPEGWRVEIGALAATLENPDVRIEQLAGWIEEAPNDAIRFQIRELRTPGSALAGAGTVRFAEDAVHLDAELSAHPLRFADLRWLVPALPEEGTAALALTVRTAADGRMHLAAREAVIEALGSRVSGHFAAELGAGRPALFENTELVLDPLDLRVLEALGLEERFPFSGRVLGTLSAAEAGVGSGVLRLDLVGTVTPRDLAGVPASTIAAEGGIGFGEAGIVLHALRVQLRPLHVEALAALLPEQRERLRGTLRGGVTLLGELADLRFVDGDLTYQVGTAAPTRLANASGKVELEPALRYEIDARAEPLALGALTELFPALPFRTATLSGPIHLAGTAEEVSFRTDLSGSAGAIAAFGSVTLGEPLAFDVSGRLEAFRAGGIVTREVPIEGPLTGTFSAKGSLEDFAFDVDLAQPEGRFALGGRVHRPGGALQVDAEGTVTNFRLGLLVGRPALFPAPMSGPIRVSGGARQPYRFDVDLTGVGSRLSLVGSYAPGAVPAYSASGTVAGLDVHQMPGAGALPPTNLVASFAVEGRGTTPETLATVFRIDAAGSTVAGKPLRTGVAAGAVSGGVLRLDTLGLDYAGTRLAAAGEWGLTHPAAAPLRFSLASTDLSQWTPVLLELDIADARLAGSLSAQGTIRGSLEAPALQLAARGRGLRYQGWRAQTLTIDGVASREAEGWTGQGTVAAGDAVLADVPFQSLRVEAFAQPTAISLGLFARRDRDTDVTLSGTVELTPERRVEGIALQRMVLRLRDAAWQLAQPTVVRYGAAEGVRVDNLVLRRSGAAEGSIEVSGVVPPSGVADLRVHLSGVDLADARRIVPDAPDLAGVLALDAEITGPVADPVVVLDGRSDAFRYGEAPLDTVALSARYAAQRLSAQVGAWAFARQAAFAEVSLPMRFALAELRPEFAVLETEPIAARISADSLPMRLLTTAVPQLRDGAGVIDGEIVVSGTPQRLDLSGSAQIEGGALTIVPLGARYDDIQGRISLAENVIRIDSLRARSGGTAVLAGTIRMDDRTRPQLFLSAAMRDFRPANDEALTTVAATGELNLSGRMPEPVLTGRITLTDGIIAVPNLGDQRPLEITDLEVGGIGADTASASFAAAGLLGQLRVEGAEIVIGEGVWIASNEARVQIGGDLLVFRAGQEMRIFGDLTAQRGSYTLRIGPLTREFDVVSGQVRFFGTPDPNPSLDITAAHRVRAATGTSLNVLVHITGTLQFPRIQLTSDAATPLAESDLLSYLIFGRASFELGDIGGQLAQQILVQEAVGGVILGQFEQVLLRTGLFDYVRIRGRPTELTTSASAALGSTAIEVGRELVPDVFWTVECGVALLFGGQMTCGTSLEWEITQQWLARASLEPLRRDPLLLRTLAPDLRYQFSTEIRRRWEYGRPTPKDQ